MVNMALVANVFIQNGTEVFVDSDSVKGLTIKRQVEIYICFVKS